MRSEGPHATAFFTGTKSKSSSFVKTKSNTTHKKVYIRTCIFTHEIVALPNVKR